MKKNKKKKFFLRKKFFLKKIITIIIFSFFIVIGITYAIDVIGDYIKTQTSIGTGTNNNKITFSHHKTTYYINKNNDNILTGDQLRGYYYDNIYGYFRLDWSQNLDKNIHIISNSSFNITGKCNKAWKFGGKAYSKFMGYIDFNYDSNKFVYYCEDDNKIYGKTYSKNLGFQNLDGIKINIREKQIINKIQQKVEIQDDNNYIEDNNSIKSNYNWNDYNIGGGDKYEIENSDINDLDGNVFWIIK